jgi:hypothetical protein
VTSLCPNCQKGKHGGHSYDFLDKDGHVRLCRCSCKDLDWKGRKEMEDPRD